MKKNHKQLLVFAGIGSAPAAFVSDRIAALCLSMGGSPILNIPDACNSVWTDIVTRPFYISLHPYALLTAAIALTAIWLSVLYKLADAGNYMPGIEHGSARWGTEKDSKYFKDAEFQNNIILTQTEWISIQSKFIKIGLDTYDPNHNVLIVGGSGSGKTRRYLAPNVMQMHSSYVITDPKGNLLYQMGDMLQENGYTIRVLNLVDLAHSDHYNPFCYLKDDLDIMRLVDNLMKNTKDPDASSGDTFWLDQARGIYCALFAYLLYETEPADRTMKNVLNLMLLAEVREDNDDLHTPLDVMFDELAERKPDCFAVVQYKKFKQSKGRTAASILATANSRLDKFYVDSVAELTSKDDLHFDHIGDDPEHPVALFIVLSDTDSSLNFLAAMMYQQLFDMLILRADNVYHGKLPCPVRFLLDEFSNIGEIPDFDKKLATIRSRNISADIILQGLSQLKKMYKDHWEIIVTNCDSLLFLGSMEQFTLEYISKLIGKTTVDNKNASESKGMNGSYSIANQILARELITPDELARLHSEECVLLISHKMPFRSLKYDPAKHPNYSKTALADKNKWFDLRKRKDLSDDEEPDIPEDAEADSKILSIEVDESLKQEINDSVQES